MRAFVYNLVKMLHAGGYFVDRLSVLDAESSAGPGSIADETASFVVASQRARYRFVVTREKV